MKSLVILAILVELIRLQLCLCKKIISSAKQTTPSNSLNAAIELARRIIPNHYHLFNFIQVDAPRNETVFDGFTLNSTSNGTVNVFSSSINGMTSGLYYYLKEYCHVQYSWMNHNLTLPAQLPNVNGTITKSSKVKYRYYMNVCTYSYSMAWWDWSRWEQELDWMALNGVNLALAFTGQEYVWIKTFQDLGLNLNELNDFFAGSAFLAWGRMGNIQGWGGKLPNYFVLNQFDLQIKILKRMKELGIIPILPAFAGFLPRAFKSHYSGIDVHQLPSWNNFEKNYTMVDFLNPTDKYFLIIGELFIKKQKELYGDLITTSFYNTDTFNENTPPSGDLDFLKNSSAIIYESMKQADPNAVWIMQGWLFYYERDFWHKDRVKALLDGVPDDKMIILDLYAENHPVWNITDSFFGKPFIWCTLHNFGGATGMHGNLNNIVYGLNDAFKNSKSMQGIGITMEGINQNYINYELTLDLAWQTLSNDFDIKRWVRDYTVRRYGAYSENVVKAWEILRNTVYNCTTGQSGPTKTKMELLPQLDMDKEGFMPTKYFYDKNVLIEVVTLLDPVAESFSSSQNFKFDYTDINKDLVSQVFSEKHTALIQAWRESNLDQYFLNQQDMTLLFKNMEYVLRDSTLLNFDNFRASALKFAQNKTEEAVYDFNVKNQLTLWGPRGENNDYASKVWMTLIRKYYRERWMIFFGFLDNSYNSKNFDTNGYSKAIFEFEQSWQNES